MIAAKEWSINDKVSFFTSSLEACLFTLSICSLFQLGSPVSLETASEGMASISNNSCFCLGDPGLNSGYSTLGFCIWSKYLEL